MINSNFTCGFYVNRERLHQIIKNKYNLNSNYDPCSYPGIQCEFYYDANLAVQTGLQTPTTAVRVSFMIFRTGSVLIVGKCVESVLREIYLFVCKLFHEEFLEIAGDDLPLLAAPEELLDEPESKKRKQHKKMIWA